MILIFTDILQGTFSGTMIDNYVIAIMTIVFKNSE